MPIYTYKDESGEYEEVFQSINDAPLSHLPCDKCRGEDCEKCEFTGRRAVKRVYTVPSVVLKGKGFYRNDK